MTIDDVKDLCAEFGYVDNGGYDSLRFWLREMLEGAESAGDEDEFGLSECDHYEASNERNAECEDELKSAKSEVVELRAELAKLHAAKAAAKPRKRVHA